jgi:hypothetical protein
MSGRPYTYSRGMAIAQLMRDMSRPVMQKLKAEKKHIRDVYLHGEDLYVSYSDTIDWVPKLEKLTKYGRLSMYLTAAQVAVETDDPKQFPMRWSEILNRQLYFEPIEGWPTEEEIAAKIAASAEREKNWNGSLSANDISAFNRMVG